ncbi:hypothetical protein [Thalassolituus hydrocarboniclasticus]|uniref:Uncharacterized protein n=1 Tax=Thalassolituus hydrocarboniclasticus TaxID=2742796 RepID=A0ABY6AAQ8_9GAMM|nr:hypothetical protein [Thalassolituus hydrocarboniclasticus]UXD87524.1 hypothetical protein HUF19_08790 [Thalassolituus hydrocarboniclasticus]
MLKRPSSSSDDVPVSPALLAKIYQAEWLAITLVAGCSLYLLARAILS